MENVKEQSTENRVLRIFARSFQKDISILSRDTRLEEDLHAKSLNYIGLIALLGSEFNTELSYAVMMRCKRIGDFIDVLESESKQA